jgi:hypothetical protein
MPLWSGDPESDKLRRAVLGWFGLPTDAPVEIQDVGLGSAPDTAPNAPPTKGTTDDTTVSVDSGGGLIDPAPEPVTAGSNGKG